MSDAARDDIDLKRAEVMILSARPTPIRTTSDSDCNFSFASLPFQLIAQAA